MLNGQIQTTTKLKNIIMKKILKFLEQLKEEKSLTFKAKIESFKSQNSEDGWNGNILEIREKKDVFLYISEDKKSMKSTTGEYDPRISFSYLVCLCHLDYVAKYINGGLETIGFYDSDYIKVTEIPFESVKIIGCNGGFSFDGQKNPHFSFDLQHKEGKEISSYRGNPFYTKTCQGVIDGIWELEKFYNNWYKELEDFEHNWSEIRGRSPKILM